MALALRATVKPLLNIKVSKAENKDLDGNKEVLGPLPKENSNRQKAAEQERNKEDNYSIASSALITSNKDHNKEDNYFITLSTLATSNKDRNEENNYSITSSALTTSNKDHDNIFNIKDNSN